jgi:hypothetical protein
MNYIKDIKINFLIKLLENPIVYEPSSIRCSYESWIVSTRCKSSELSNARCSCDDFSGKRSLKSLITRRFVFLDEDN